MILEIDGEGEYEQSKFELRPQNKEVSRILNQALPQSIPCGNEHWFDDSISISIDQSVSNQSVSSYQYKNVFDKDGDMDKLSSEEEYVL
jgi:hypothetical protein